jgi:hypothetical protein
MAWVIQEIDCIYVEDATSQSNFASDYNNLYIENDANMGLLGFSKDNFAELVYFSLV